MNLGDSIEGSADIENAFWVAWNALRHHDTSTALLADFVDMGASSANDDGSILSDDETAHMYVG